jgi:DNA-binding transcriptional LysR family regulator
VDLLGALQSFVRVVETGSFSAVAREQGTSQSSITRQIGQLEEHFGVRLLHRTTRRLNLTHDGQDLLAHARHLLDTAQGMEAALGRHRSTPVGHVRLGTTVALGLFLTPRLPALLARYPGLSVELTMRDGPADMIEERLDVATFLGPPSDASLVGRPMGTYGRIAVASPAYIALRGEPERPAELSGHDCIIHARAPDAADWPFKGPDGPFSVAVTGPFAANNSEAVHRAVLAGLGIAMMIDVQVHDDLRHGRLAQVLTPWAAPRAQSYVAYPSRRHLAPRTRVVIDFILEQVRQLREQIEP